MTDKLIPFYHGSCFSFDRLRSGSWVTSSYTDAVMYARVRCADHGISPDHMRVYCVMADSENVYSDYVIDNDVRVARVRSADICGVISHKEILRLSSDDVLRIVRATPIDITHLIKS